MRILPTLTLLFAMALNACAPPARKGEIVPGKPFVVLHNVEADCVRERLLTHMVERGWTVKSIGDGRLVAEAVAPAFINTPARQAGYAQPLVRMTVLGVPVGQDIEIVVDPYVVTNPGTRSERLEPIEPTAGMQQTLNDAGRTLEEYCARK